jgi:hypothetical protein
MGAAGGHAVIRLAHDETRMLFETPIAGRSKAGN